MKDEKLYTQFGSIRSSFPATPIFNFLTLRGSLCWTGWNIFVRYIRKLQEFNNLSKTGSFVEIFQRKPTKIICLVKKVVKNRRFWVIFSNKTRYCSLDSLDRGTKVGFKMKYNCYMLPIEVLKIFIWSWWRDNRVRTCKLVKNRNFHLFDKGRFLSSKWPDLIDYSLKCNFNLILWQHERFKVSVLSIEFFDNSRNSMFWL